MSEFKVLTAYNVYIKEDAKAYRVLAENAQDASDKAMAKYENGEQPFNESIISAFVDEVVLMPDREVIKSI